MIKFLVVIQITISIQEFFKGFSFLKDFLVITLTSLSCFMFPCFLFRWRLAVNPFAKLGVWYHNGNNRKTISNEQAMTSDFFWFL